MGSGELIADEELDIVHVQTGAVGAIVRSEVEAQLDAAHKYKRSISRFLQDAQTMATLSQEVAESCIYSLPRMDKGEQKMITGPSVRLAEICASAYGNMHVGGRVVDEGDKEVTAQGGAWDLEKNLRVTVEARRRITNRAGRRYNDDMILVTSNAAVSIAIRNAILRVIPRAYIDLVYQKVRLVAVGDQKTLSTRRSEIIARLNKLGVPTDRILLRLGRQGIDDVGLDDLEILIGLGTSIKSHDVTIDEAFSAPAPAPAPAAPSEDGKRVAVKGREPGSDG